MSILNPGDPLPAEKFAIQIDGIQSSYIKTISGLTTSVDTINHNAIDGQGNTYNSVMPGSSKAGNFTITRGADNNDDFNTWVQQGINGETNVCRRNISVIYLDYMNNPIRRFNMQGAWCASRGLSDVEAGSSNILTETIIVHYNSIKEEKG